ASFIILDEDTDIVWATQKMIHFFKHESCGKCSPCREGTYWLDHLYHRIRSGKASNGDVDLLTDITHQMAGNTFCLLGEFATAPVESSIKQFRDEYEKYVK
ncbi:MAG TPA: NADH-quinone oxidoreductase subunit F, partial [Chloroflexi bacterium]|nr:NADH-quinone oxidoreductase subunit F [Chloroflexota bacterium]